MELIATILSWVCLMAGSAFAVIGGIGLLRLPDFYARMHGGGITDTMGASLIFLGLMFQSGLSLITFKLVITLFFLLITSSTSAHALAGAAMAVGIKPRLAPEEASSSKS